MHSGLALLLSTAYYFCWVVFLPSSSIGGGMLVKEENISLNVHIPIASLDGTSCHAKSEWCFGGYLSVAKEGEILSPLAISAVVVKYLAIVRAQPMFCPLFWCCLLCTSILCSVWDALRTLLLGFLSCCPAASHSALSLLLWCLVWRIFLSLFPCPLTASLFYSSFYTSVCVSVHEDPSRPVLYTSFSLAAHLHLQFVPTISLKMLSICWPLLHTHSHSFSFKIHINYNWFLHEAPPQASPKLLQWLPSDCSSEHLSHSSYRKNLALFGLCLFFLLLLKKKWTACRSLCVVLCARY